MSSDGVGTAVLGAGPAGLTAAYALALNGHGGVVYEADASVGGMARTIRRGSYRFDLGGQLFSTGLEPIAHLWQRILGDELVLQPRRSRILYGGRYLEYALRARHVVSRLGLSSSAIEWEGALRQLDELSLPPAGPSVPWLRRPQTTTLVEDLHYPRLGPGQMWERLETLVVDHGIPIRLEHRCVAVTHEAGRVRSVRVRCGGNGLDGRVDAVLSSIPLGELVRLLDPPPPAAVLEAAARLRHRRMCLVALMVAEEPFSECWIHVRDRSVRATRVLNFGALSRDMVAPGTTCLGVEYFCDVGDRIWTMSEAEAIELAKRELAGLGLLDDRRVFDGARIRVPRAYPIRGRAGEDALAVVRDHLQEIENLQTFGRDGLHCASTQDHSMWTALLAATNLLHGTSHDVWAVAQDLAPGDAEPHPPASYIPPLGEAVGDLAG